MTAPEDAPIADSTAIQLTRMEGILMLVDFKLGEIIQKVAGHEARLGKVELDVQRLGDAAVANERTVEQTAKALKDAKEATEAQARADTAKSNQAWTPFQRSVTLAGGVAALVGTLAAFGVFK